MTVQELFRAVLWDDVARRLEKLYPEYAGSLPGFEKVFSEVILCEPMPDPDKIKICIEYVEDEGESWWSVYGRAPDGEEYGLDYSLFREWAGFQVDEELCKRMSLPEIVAHVLWEMTFYGFSEEEILARRRELEEGSQEYEEENIGKQNEAPNSN